MSGQYRLYPPDSSFHVLQRGSQWNPAFFDEVDCHTYLDILADVCAGYQVRLHAYVLMPDYVQLLMTPGDKASTSCLMRTIGRRYAYYFNRRFYRSGSPWDRPCHSMEVDAGSALLACMRCIELAPARAGMVVDPAAYRWSSFRRNALGDPDRLVTPHRVYRSLG